MYTCRPCTGGIHESHAAPKPAKLGNWTKSVPRKQSLKVVPPFHRPPRWPSRRPLHFCHVLCLDQISSGNAAEGYPFRTVLCSYVLASSFGTSLGHGEPVFLFGNGRIGARVLLLQGLHASVHHLLAELGYLKKPFRC